MLQYLCQPNGRFSMAEQAQMMIEGGCTWIQVTAPDEGLTMRDTLLQLSDLCRENEAFLMIDSDVEISQELRIHGVYLRKGDMAPAAAREYLGPHAVIGVQVESVADIEAIRGLDMDYAVAEFSSHEQLDATLALVGELHAAVPEMPVVVRGPLDPVTGDITRALSAGASGVAIGRTLIDAGPDPVVTCRTILNPLIS